jgi:hypothetical protein
MEAFQTESCWEAEINVFLWHNYWAQIKTGTVNAN